MTTTLPESGTDADEQSVLAMLTDAITSARARPGNDLDFLPRRLSPSRASDFAQCPQLFYYKTIAGIPTPGTLATTKGTLCHAAFERTFDHTAGDRTPELTISYLRPEWEKMTDPALPEADFPLDSPERAKELARAADYRTIAPAGSEIETQLLDEAEDVVRSWYAMERVQAFDPTEIAMPDGTVVDGRELHVAAEMFGVNLHGFIDRLDRWLDTDGKPHYGVSDYKTGSVPGSKKPYPPAVQERIAWDAMFQLRVYAVLCKEMFGIDVTLLRLVYVKTGDRDKGIKTLRVTEQILNRTRNEVRDIWRDIMRSARTGEWETKTGPLCGWCFFHDICPAFNDLGSITVDQDRTTVS